MPTTLTASALSATLRRAGFLPSHDRKREGVRVRRSALPGVVVVSADLDSLTAAVRLASDLETALVALGYVVERDGSRMTVTR